MLFRLGMWQKDWLCDVAMQVIHETTIVELANELRFDTLLEMSYVCTAIPEELLVSFEILRSFQGGLYTSIAVSIAFFFKTQRVNGMVHN